MQVLEEVLDPHGRMRWVAAPEHGFPWGHGYWGWFERGFIETAVGRASFVAMLNEMTRALEREPAGQVCWVRVRQPLPGEREGCVVLCVRNGPIQERS